MAANGAVAENVVNGIIDAKAEGWEEDVGANIEVAEGATAWHAFMFAKGIKRPAEAWACRAPLTKIILPLRLNFAVPSPANEVGFRHRV